MKIRTRLAIFLIAAVLSLAAFSAIFSGLSVDKILTAATPSAYTKADERRPFAYGPSAGTRILPWLF